MAGSLFKFQVVCILVSFSGCFKPSFGDGISKDETSSHQSTSRTVVAATVLIVLLVAVMKWYCGGGVCRSKARLDGKTVIVTGANTGIGKETALDFAKRGARVILACRNKEKASKAAKDIIAESGSDKVLVRIVDLSSFESVRAFAKLINETEERLDILVNNAALGVAPYDVTVDGHESIFQVNFLSQFLLTLLLAVRMKESSPSRIVNVSTNGHIFVKELRLEDFKLSQKNFNSSYRYLESALAKIIFSRDLSQRLKGTGITVYSIHPGAVTSDIWRYWTVLEKPLIKQIFQVVKFIFFKNCKQGAQTSIYCSVAEELAGVSGLFYADCKVKECSNLAKDPGLMKKLWEASERITGESWKD